MKMIDVIITSGWFNFIPRLIIKLWSPISERQHYLFKIEIHSIFDKTDPEWDAYEDIYGTDATHKKYGCRSSDCSCSYPVNFCDVVETSKRG